MMRWPAGIFFLALIALVPCGAGHGDGARGAVIRHIQFRALQVWLDPHGKALACYQISVHPVAGEMKLVGIEGGSAGPFNDAPYYDPRALQRNGRVMLGAYSLAPNLPAGLTRLATLMFEVVGDAEPKLSADVIVAADAQALPLGADVSLRWMAPSSTTPAAGDRP